MRSLINTALICAVTLGTVSVAEAMPAAVNPAPAMTASTGAQVEKAAVVITTRRVVRRPPPRRVVKKVIIR